MIFEMLLNALCLLLVAFLASAIVAVVQTTVQNYKFKRKDYKVAMKTIDKLASEREDILRQEMKNKFQELLNGK